MDDFDHEKSNLMTKVERADEIVETEIEGYDFNEKLEFTKRYQTLVYAHIDSIELLRKLKGISDEELGDLSQRLSTIDQ